MDRNERTANIIKHLYSYRRKTMSAEAYIKEVCEYFDFIKDQSISEADLNFLLFLANEVGIPQYYQLLLSKFTDCRISEENQTALAMGAYFHSASLSYGDKTLHRYQKSVLDCFSSDKMNRFVLTAPTSFGKTFVVYEIIKKMHYRNILLIFPAISLLSENYAKICKERPFDQYKIHTLSEEEFNPSDNNIFIFTPERFLSFIDANHNTHFDFIFIDEVYKIDNSFLIDEDTVAENERDIAYRIALEYASMLTDDMLLAGPYMELPKENSKRKSFYEFARDKGITFLQYNQYEIVTQEIYTIKNKKEYNIGSCIVNIGAIGKKEKLINVLVALSGRSESTIVYCGTRAKTESYAKNIIENKELRLSFEKRINCQDDDTIKIFKAFLKHLKATFGEDWIVYKALKCGVGVHHSLIPKYIQKEIIRLFNYGLIVCLFSTTTITEGVNTSAKNIIILSNKKGSKPLRQFDAKNIAGRAGRFTQHYSGRVIDINNHFEDIVKAEPETLEHKNYDKNSSKTDVDYQITKEEYLSETEVQDKIEIQKEVNRLGISEEIFNMFRVVGPRYKLTLFHGMMEMSKDAMYEVKKMIVDLAQSKARKLYLPGFQAVIDMVSPIITETKLKELVENRIAEYSIVTYLLKYYLQDGFLGMVNYYTKKKGMNTDQAIKTVADEVYNVFKYTLVKYLGIFDNFYRYLIAQKEDKGIEEVGGVGLLLQKLEYNALNPVARKVSDYGVPFKLLDYYENGDYNNDSQFDEYENRIFHEIKDLFVEK